MVKKTPKTVKNHQKRSKNCQKPLKRVKNHQKQSKPQKWSKKTQKNRKKKKPKPPKAVKNHKKRSKLPKTLKCPSYSGEPGLSGKGQAFIIKWDFSDLINETLMVVIHIFV